MRRAALALAALACGCSERGEAPPGSSGDAEGASLAEILPGDPRAGAGGIGAGGSAGGADPLLGGAGGGEGDSRGHIGVVVARETVDVAARHVGEVAEVFVRIGDEVKAGDPIARLDEDSIREARAVTRAELSASRAELAQARVDLQEARDRLQRRRELKNTVSSEDLEAAQFAVERAKAVRDRARADVNRQQAKLREIDRQLGDANIVAPLPGTVATRFVDPGALVDPGEPIARLIASEGSWIRFALPPKAAASLELDARVEAEIESSDKTFPAIVRQIAPQIDPESRMVLVEAELRVPEDSPVQIYSGLPVRVRLKMGASEVAPASEATEEGDAPNPSDGAPPPEGERAPRDAGPAAGDAGAGE